MKISICIPQYNRIKFLLHSLREIENQAYNDLEVIISDDCSTDNTEESIKEISGKYRFPIKYFRHATNQGYDKNLRTSIELASGEYIILIGNDDTINPGYDLGKLVTFLIGNNYPDVGFTSFIDANTGLIESRASKTSIIGKGPEVAFSNYSRFSFVGGVIFKRATFLEYNTAKFDGSVYAQMYLSSLIISSGGVLFSFAEPVVIKDILPQEQKRGSYTDVIAKKWKDYKAVNGGLPAVIRVLTAAFDDAGVMNQKIIYGIFRKIYGSTFPFWIVNYRTNKALPEAVGLVVGMRPNKIEEYSRLKLSSQIKINFLYSIVSVTALLVPISLFESFKDKLWRIVNSTHR